MSLGAAIGAITFSGSIIAFLKLRGIMSGSPITFTGQHIINLFRINNFIFNLLFMYNPISKCFLVYYTLIFYCRSIVNHSYWWS